MRGPDRPEDVVPFGQDALPSLRDLRIVFVFRSFGPLPSGTALDDICMPPLYRGGAPDEAGRRMRVLPGEPAAGAA